MAIEAAKQRGFIEGDELKHGPIALLDKHTPVAVTAPKNSLTNKLLSTIQEVQARNAPLFIIGDVVLGIISIHKKMSSLFFSPLK